MKSDQRKGLNMARRGMSPLIATVLLIAFAVALGAVILNIRNFNPGGIITGTGSPGCAEDLSITIHNLNGPQLYYGGSGQAGYISFTIDNTGLKTVEGLTVLVEGDKDKLRMVFDDISIAPVYDFSKKIDYDFTKYGTIQQVTFIPIVTYNNKKVNCTLDPIKNPGTVGKPSPASA